MSDNFLFTIAFWRCDRCGAIHVPDKVFDPDCVRCEADKLILSNARASHRRRGMRVVMKTERK